MSVAVLPQEIASGEVRRDVKSLGAYYTDQQVADFLVRWALPTRSGKVLDPSFGGGAFLLAACRRGRRQCEVFGVEIEPETHQSVSTFLEAQASVTPSQLICADFFAVGPEELPPMDAVVGNPPFVRYQRFKGEARERAMERVAEYGLALPKLASMWAPFVVHSVGFLRLGGRLAMVLPMELAHARYARPVLQFLAQRFRKLHLVSFQRPLFASLNEDTVLLLAEEHVAPTGRLAEMVLHDLCNALSLDTLELNSGGVDLGGFLREQKRFVEYFLPESTRDLYARLQAIGLARRLGTLADIGIGYVSGNNGFFHPSAEVQRQWRLPARSLKRAVFSGAAMAGLEFNGGDWAKARDAGNAGHLLHLSGNDSALASGVSGYVRQGERDEVHQAYKCRVRPCWYAVPHVHVPDGFLTYMSGMQTQLVANAANAVASNTLHLVRMHREAGLGIYDLCARWQTSLTQLSVEIEGHALGGGMLKLEPTEAENVRVACGQSPAPIPEVAARELDVSLRAGEFGCVRDLADRMFLMEELGLSRRECDILRDGALLLRNRRVHRKRGAS